MCDVSAPGGAAQRGGGLRWPLLRPHRLPGVCIRTCTACTLRVHCVRNACALRARRMCMYTTTYIPLGPRAAHQGTCMYRACALLPGPRVAHQGQGRRIHLACVALARPRRASLRGAHGRVWWQLWPAERVQLGCQRRRHMREVASGEQHSSQLPRPPSRPVADSAGSGWRCSSNEKRSSRRPEPK